LHACSDSVGHDFELAITDCFGYSDCHDFALAISDYFGVTSSDCFGFTSSVWNSAAISEPSSKSNRNAHGVDIGDSRFHCYSRFLAIAVLAYVFSI
jgi:hypothetical protein